MRRLILVPLLVLGLALLLAVSAPPPAEAQFAVFDAVNWIENALQVIQQIVEIYQKYEQLAGDIEHYKTMVQNLESFDSVSLRSLTGLAANVNHIIQEGRALGHTLEDIESQFTMTFTGYEPLLSEDWWLVFDERTDRTLATLQKVLKAVLRVSHSSVPAQDILGRLAQDVEEAEGNLQALQAGNQLLHHQSTEIAKLNQQLSLLANVQTVYFAYELDRKASAQATTAEWFANGVLPVPFYDSAGGSRGVPRNWSCPGCGT